MSKHMKQAEDRASNREPLGRVSSSQNVAATHSKQPERSGGGKKPSKNMLSNILIAVGVVLLLVAGGIYLHNMWNYHKIDETNDRIAEYAKLTDDSEQPPSVDWAALKEMNSDIVGWLEVPGTVINYPVFQTGDNSYYLNTAPDKSSSIGGSVFMDYENTAPGMVDAQTIVYGHHMRNGSQFKVIADMDKQEMFDGIKLIWYCTEQNNYDLVPLFLYYTGEEDTDVRQFKFDNLEAFHRYLMGYYDKAQTKRSDAEQIIAQVRHVFTLSTCNYYDGYGRTLLVCVPRSEVPGLPQYDAETAKRVEEEERRAEEEAKRKAEEARAAQEGEGEVQEEVVVEEEVVEEG